MTLEKTETINALNTGLEGSLLVSGVTPSRSVFSALVGV